MESTTIIDLNINHIQPIIPNFELPKNDLNIHWPNPPLTQEQHLLEHKLYATLTYAQTNHLDHIILDSPKTHINIITSNKSYLDVYQTLNILDIDNNLTQQINLRLYKVSMV